MKSNNDLFNKEIDDRKTDKKFIIPQWVSCLAFMSVVACKPVGYIPSLIIIFFFGVLKWPLSYFELSCLFGGLLLIMSAIVSLFRNNMAAKGILENYTSMIFADYAVPRLLKKKFGIAIGGDCNPLQ